ncbi:MAG TPA: hypothetical protein VFQ35_15090 [Polyangiaceae bacterium]|nr:hypothetical protein [Polyangiaceae bacterium]
MTFSRFWTPVRARSKPDVLPESVEADEPETGVLSLRQLMDSLGPVDPAFDPDSTAHFSTDLLRRRSVQLASREPEPPSPSPEAPPPEPEPQLTSLQAGSPTERTGSRRLSPITLVSLVLLVPATALLFVPRGAPTVSPTSVEAPSQPRETPKLRAAADHHEVHAPAPPALADEKGITRERSAVDHLAAGDFTRALEDYRAISGRSPAHAAAVRILGRKLKAEQSATP